MRGRTHLLIAGSAALVASTAMHLSTTAAVAAVTAACVGGLLPDIDHKNSTISKEMKVTSFVARSVSSHRGLFHAPLLWCILGAILYFALPEPYCLLVAPVMLGVASHLLLDILNPTGIPLLWPITKKKMRLARVRTGGKLDKAIGFVAPILAIAISFFLVR